ncbi:lytic transglycosylase domain-containing protein [Pontixanthobacter luteolus]|nr:lytic transglycosylase domain-containing protein [Pontixanthobacter luteolus]
MILNWTGRILIPLAFAAISVPASADVMEVGEEGARWVTGEQVMLRAADTAVQSDDLTVLGADFHVPMNAVADPALHARAIPPEFNAAVHELARRFDLSPALLEAVVWQESRWRTNAVSPAGARGLAQLMPSTARELGVNPDDPFANLEGGARYLREQLDRFDGDLEKALAAYNAGPGRVERAGGIPRIRETQEYVAAIIGRLSNHSRSSN